MPVFTAGGAFPREELGATRGAVNAAVRHGRDFNLPLTSLPPLPVPEIFFFLSLISPGGNLGELYSRLPWEVSPIVARADPRLHHGKLPFLTIYGALNEIIIGSSREVLA